MDYAGDWHLHLGSSLTHRNGDIDAMHTITDAGACAAPNPISLIYPRLRNALVVYGVRPQRPCANQCINHPRHNHSVATPSETPRRPVEPPMGAKPSRKRNSVDLTDRSRPELAPCIARPRVGPLPRGLQRHGDAGRAWCGFAPRLANTFTVAAKRAVGIMK